MLQHHPPFKLKSVILVTSLPLNEDGKGSRSDRRWNHHWPCANAGPLYWSDAIDLRRPCPCSPQKEYGAGPCSIPEIPSEDSALCVAKRSL